MVVRRSPPTSPAKPGGPPATPAPPIVKQVDFLGTSLKDLKDFPDEARQEAGFQLDQVQRGREPDSWKPMSTIGPGVMEIKIKEASGEFRVIYAAKYDDVVYVLHCFQKKTQRTSSRDKELAKARYKEIGR